MGSRSDPRRIDRAALSSGGAEAARPRSARRRAATDGSPSIRACRSFEDGWSRVQSAAREAGRSPQDLTAALYTTIVLGEPAKAQAELEQFLSTYYNAPAAAMLKRQACYAGAADGCLEWMARFVQHGVRHILIRFAGASDQMAQLERAARELLPPLTRLG